MSHDIDGNGYALYARAAHYMGAGEYTLAQIYIRNVIEKYPDMADKEFVRGLAREIAERVVKNG